MTMSPFDTLILRLLPGTVLRLSAALTENALGALGAGDSPANREKALLLFLDAETVRRMNLCVETMLALTSVIIPEDAPVPSALDLRQMGASVTHTLINEGLIGLPPDEMTEENLDQILGDLPRLDKDSSPFEPEIEDLPEGFENSQERVLKHFRSQLACTRLRLCLEFSPKVKSEIEDFLESEILKVLEELKRSLSSAPDRAFAAEKVLETNFGAIVSSVKGLESAKWLHRRAEIAE